MAKSVEQSPASCSRQTKRNICVLGINNRISLNAQPINMWILAMASPLNVCHGIRTKLSQGTHASDPSAQSFIQHTRRVFVVLTSLVGMLDKPHELGTCWYTERGTGMTDVSRSTHYLSLCFQQ